MDHVVVDVEIQKCVEDTPGGWDATDKLGVAVACVWEYKTDRMRVYGPGDLEALRNRLMAADRISGFNIFNFDFPVIWGVGKQDWINAPAPGAIGKGIKGILAPKTDDLLRRIWQSRNLNPDVFAKATHGGFSLDVVARSTLDQGKIGNGADAPKWFQAGEVQRVVNYCADDVALERDLTDFVDRHGYVCKDGRQYYIPHWTGA